MLLSISVLVSAQDVKPEKVTVADQTSQIIDKVFDKTTEAITNLATALKVPSEHVYAVLVKQQQVRGISIIIALVLSVIISIISFKALQKRIGSDKYGYGENDLYWTILVASLILLLIFSILTIVLALPAILNPEYGAMQEIIQAIK
jgi:hypothetical protein